MHRRVLVLLLAVSVVVLAGCRVRTEVAIDVEPDGSGVVTVTVELDASAARRLGDPSTALRLDDLRIAGWDVADPETAEDGSITLVGTRTFAAADQLAAVLDEIGGPEGVFRDVELEIEDRFGATDHRFAASVHLSGSVEQFSDDALAGALDGMPLARSAEALAAAGDADPEAVTLRISVALPGGEPQIVGDRAGVEGGVEGGRAVWEMPVTGGEPTAVDLAVTSTSSRGRTRVLVGVAVVALAAAALAAAVGARRARS